MNGKRTSEKANGVRFVLAAQTFVLEPSKRSGTLTALGLFADMRTKFSTCSLTALAAISRQSTRNVNRVLAEWRDPALQHLVFDVGMNTGGPGAARLYRVHWERIRLIGAAVGVARRAVGAGAYTALDARDLLGAPATLENCAQLMSVLQAKLVSEQMLGSARRIERLQSRLSSVFDGWPDRILDQAELISPRADFDHMEPVSFEDDPTVDNHPAQSVDNLPNPDRLSPNPDRLSSRGNKEYSPQGDQNVFDPAQPALFSDVELMPTNLTFIAAVAGGSARRRSEIGEALVGCQAGTFDGWLVIRSSGPMQCDKLHSLWFGTLLEAAQKLGYRGLFITDRTAKRDQSRVGDDSHGRS